MPVHCSFAECEELATGACRRCGRDFCPRHRFVTPQGAAVLDLCLGCAVAEAEARAYASAVREGSLASIRRSVGSLIGQGVMPPDAFVWVRRTQSRWWAFGRFGRSQVKVAIRRGWPVGDFPWEGADKVAPGRSASAVYVRPTYVDAKGEIAPRDAARASILDARLFTDEMCRQVADTMQGIETAQLEAPHPEAAQPEAAQPEADQPEADQPARAAASAESSMAGTSNEW